MATNNSEKMASSNGDKHFLMVEREPYKKDGRDFNAYVVKGSIRGKAVKVGLIPPDVGGYGVYDIIFGGSDKAKLDCVPYEITDDRTGEIKKGYTYELFDVDEDGTEYRAKINPNRSSDKALLAMLQSQIDFANKK